MSRLTKRINHHYTPRKDIRLGAYSECVQKLGRLEDLEEQGRLIIIDFEIYKRDDLDRCRMRHCNKCDHYRWELKELKEGVE